jgi:hypothetical protein
MSYPGDQRRPGGWPAEQPPQPPYGAGPGQPEPAGYDQTAVISSSGRPYAGASYQEQPYPEQPHPEHSYPEQSYQDHSYTEQSFPDHSFPEHPFPEQSYGEPYAGRPHTDQPYAGQPHTESRTTDRPNGRGRRRRESQTRRGHSPLIVGGAIVAGAVLIATGMGVSSMLRDDSTKTAASTAPPSQAVTTSPSKRPLPGNSRATDPVPLTLSEIFRHRRFTVGGTRYGITVWRADRICTRTVHGATLMAALRKGSCSQVMRATFASADGKLIGTVGVANLRTATAAKAATRVWNAKDAWLQPVPGPGITKNIGTGSALGSFQNKGHYLLMTWVQQPSGKAIPTAQQKLVSAFGQSVMLGSGLYEALNYRGTEGRPLPG